MSNSVKREKKQFVINVIIVVIILFVVVAVIWVLSSGRETIIDAKTEIDNYEAVICKSSSDEASFFKNDFEKELLQEVKILLKNNKMESLSLSYNAILDSNNSAEKMGGIMHANYNKYFSSYNMNPAAFSPDVSVEDRTVKFTLFGNVNNLNTYTASLFSIDSSDYYKVKSFSVRELKSYYENKGFSCTLQE